MVVSTAAVPPEAAEPDARARLRAAALDRFGRQGVSATGTREIVAAAGLRNPSAIHYYFGSKEGLVEDLTDEFRGSQAAVLRSQVELGTRGQPPTPTAWAAVVVEYSAQLLASERGCLLTRIWAEFDDANPEATDGFLAGPHPLATAWRDAIAVAFPDLPPAVAVARNLVALRTAQWITARRALRILNGEVLITQTDAARAWLLELLVILLTSATTMTAEAIAQL